MNSCKTFPGADINLPKEWMGEENGNEELEKNMIRGLHILNLVMIEKFLNQGKFEEYQWITNILYRHIEKWRNLLNVIFKLQEARSFKKSLENNRKNARWHNMSHIFHTYKNPPFLHLN